MSTPNRAAPTRPLCWGFSGIVLCWFVAPFALIAGVKEMKAINEGRRPGTGGRKAGIAVLLGTIGTGLLVISVFVVVVPVFTGFEDFVYCFESGNCEGLPRWFTG